jgi:hypothetical protein
VHDTKYAAYMIHFAREITVRNNVFALGRLEQLYRGRPEPHKSVFFENNIVYWTEGTLFAKRWQDVPYTFHFHPKDETGDREVTSTFDIDYNVYFNPTKSLDEVTFHEGTFAEWHKRGKDAHSVYADPQFVDVERRDFRLKPTSPALALGFQPIDLSNVGPRTPTGPSTRPVQADARDSDVDGLRPFTDGANYLGEYETGLYPGGTNEIPSSHLEAGRKIGATIRPLDVDGNPDERAGRVVALVMGHSNCKQYFAALQDKLRAEPSSIRPRFEMLSAAVNGNQLPEIRRLSGPVWDKADELLSRPGYSPKQVRVLFLHTTYHGWKNLTDAPPGPFPQTMQRMRDDLAAVLRHAAEKFPNLKVVYLTSDGLRRYTGFEPHVWQESFAIKWLIEAQINGDESARGLPWLQWGPYLWDPTWDRSYFTDGVHPSAKAREVFVSKYWRFLSDDPVAQAWLFAR